MRRKDREITNVQNIVDILQRTDVLRIGLSVEDRPYIVPMNFGFEIKDDENIVFYLHGARSGKKIDMMRKNNRICFEADIMHQIVAEEKPQNWTTTYESITGEGAIKELLEPDEKLYALSAIMKKAGYQKELTLESKILEHVMVMKIIVETIVGKVNSIKPTKQDEQTNPSA